MKHPAPIWITTAIACILLIACRTNKEVEETQHQSQNQQETAATNPSEPTSVASGTTGQTTTTAIATAGNAETGQTTASVAATVQPDTAHWQLVYPKTAKTECDLWRKGKVYTLDTNDVKFYKVDTNCAVILVDCSWSGGPMPAFKFADYAISGGAQYRRPSGMSFISFLESLEPEPEIVRISYNTTRFLVRGKTVKTSETLYKQRKQYYSYGRIIQGYRMDGKVESGKIEVHYKDNPDWEQINIPKNIFLEDFADSLEQCDHIDSIVYVGIEEMIDDAINSVQSDSDRSEQWGLERIYAQDAWDITMGDSNLVVAVLELDGIDWSHYELGKGYDNYQNICINNGEDSWPDTVDAAGRKRYKLGGNGLDDDGDSLVDNFIGWNFRDSNKNCRTDSCHHGTMVAGIIAAKTNNGRGISGIAGGDSCAGVKILPYATRSHFTFGLKDVIQKNVDIANMSFHIKITSIYNLNKYNSYLQNAFNHGVVLIAAAGNDSTHSFLDTVRYPARNPYVMAVGAIDKDNRRAHFSCYGPELSVVAPGRGIRTLTKGNKFINASGTSFAAPHVTGVAALMLSVNPNLTPADVRRIIEKTARKVGGYNYHNDPQHPNGTWNEEMGYGLVDAHAAVLNVVDSTLNLYVRDAEGDDGSEPSVTSTPWNSPDIWIEDTKGKEVSSLMGLQAYNVCVRIHNRTDHASTGYEKLYLNWVKAGPGSDWSAAWQGEKKLTGDGGSISLGYPIIGGNSRKGHAIPVISAGRDTVVKVRWITPEPDYYSAFYNSSELRHFCLCARIHDGRRIENEDADSVNMGDFVKNSSHVAWKNIIIMEAGIQKAFLSVYSTKAKPICLRYAGCANVAGEQLHNFSEAKLKLDTGLYSVWKRGGFTSNGFVMQADSSLLLQSANAELCNLLLDTGRIYLMQTSVLFNNKRIPQNDTFHADIMQYYEYEENGIPVSELVGGEHIKAIRSGDCEYTVHITGDTDLIQGESATFTATGAESYRWYNAGGELLSAGESMTAVPAYSQCYYLESTGGLCGYVSRDTVCVHVSEGEIVTLYPNPTNDNIHVEYQITGNYINASIQITNELGTTQQTVTLNEPQGSVTLDVQGLHSGAYYVLLKSPTGKVLDVKTLVKGE